MEAKRLSMDGLVRRIGVGRLVLSVLPDNLQVSLRKKAWYKRAQSGELLVEADQLKPHLEAALRHIALVDRDGVGDYLEFGVFNGTSMIAMHDVLKASGLDHVRLFGFDSFEGLPAEAASDENRGWRPGCFAADMESTRARLTAAGVDETRATLIKGWFSDTLNAATIERQHLRKASVIMIDADIYTASKEALNFCASLIADHAVIIFDDWHSSEAAINEGQKKAFDEFLAEHTEFRAENVGGYSLNGAPAGEVFNVRRVGAEG